MFEAARNKHAFLSCVKTLKRISKTDVVGISPVSFAIKASSNKENLALAMATLEAMPRVLADDL